MIWLRTTKHPSTRESPSTASPFAAQDGDKAAFTQLITLLREAEELQPSDEAREAFRASPVTIADRAGNPHSMSVQEVRGLIVQYGLQLNELWVNYAKNRAVIAASSIQSLNNQPTI